MKSLYETELDFKNALCVIGCSKRKRKNKTIAEKLYLGTLFKKSVEYCKLMKFDFIIVSAKYGVLLPDQMIEPYDKVLKNKKDADLLLQKIDKNKINELFFEYDNIIFFCGKYYRYLFDFYEQKHKFINGVHKTGLFKTIENLNILTNINKKYKQRTLF